MAAQRPVILEALRSTLALAVTTGERICFPWDAQLDPKDGPMIQVAMGEGRIDDGYTIGLWRHLVSIRIGAVVAGAFDYPSTWDILAEVSAALVDDYTLGGTCTSITFTGCGDSIEVAGDKIMWPHLAATIEYMTPQGAV
jgi:hypothetical protein